MSTRMTRALFLAPFALLLLAAFAVALLIETCSDMAAGLHGSEKAS